MRKYITHHFIRLLDWNQKERHNIFVSCFYLLAVIGFCVSAVEFGALTSVRKEGIELIQTYILCTFAGIFSLGMLWMSFTCLDWAVRDGAAPGKHEDGLITSSLMVVLPAAMAYGGFYAIQMLLN